MIDINNDKCCGCSACVNICPTQCISFSPDGEGFFAPQIDYTKCQKCNLCISVCPSFPITDHINIRREVYYAYNLNKEQRLYSSSGGIFILLAKAVLNLGGVVFGAAFSDDY